jgi:hypothetical protein
MCKAEDITPYDGITCFDASPYLPAIAYGISSTVRRANFCLSFLAAGCQ